MAGVCVEHLEFERDVHAGVGKKWRTPRQCYLADLLIFQLFCYLVFTVPGVTKPHEEIVNSFFLFLCLLLYVRFSTVNNI